jgi:hypothetical protein
MVQLVQGSQMEEEEDTEFSQLLDEAARTEESSASEAPPASQGGELRDDPERGLRLILGVLVVLLLAGIGCILYVLNPPITN